MPIISKDAHWVYWSLDSQFELTEEVCEAHQASLGYHPMGYGFYAPRIVKEGDRWQAKWHCSSSCD